ncbi:MAG: hypothetical protein V3V19_06810 [Cocleimonas sp.]
MLKINQIIVLSFLGFGLTACGGGGGSKAKSFGGSFKEKVQGMSYSSGGQKGTTGKNGEFRFEENKNVSFSVGGIQLGSGKGKTIMTPVDLVNGGSLEKLEVINRVRLLMMLDKNNDRYDGIEISDKVSKSIEQLKSGDKKINFTLTESAFSTDGNVSRLHRLVTQIEPLGTSGTFVDRPFPTSKNAKKYLSDTLERIKKNQRCVDAGGFVGTYSGKESGKVAFLLDPATGAVKGAIFNKEIGSAIEVTTKTVMNHSSKKFVSESSMNMIFQGSLKSGNILEGTWADSTDTKKTGTFKAQRIAGKSGANYRYTATYDNLNRGLLAIDLDKSSKVTGTFYDVVNDKTLTIAGSSKDGDFVKTTLSDGGKITGFIGNGSVSGQLKEKGTTTSHAFSGNGCKLN